MKKTRRVPRVGRWASLSLSPVTLWLTALSALLAIVVLANDFGILTPDTKPEIFLAPARTAARFASAWLDTPNLGTPNFNVGNFLVAAIFSVLDLVGLPAWLIMRLWRMGLLLLAAWGARLVLRELLGQGASSRFTNMASLGAAIAYAANPYVLVGGATTPTLLPYALLPWLVVCWLRGFREPSWRWAVASALVLAAMSGINAGVVPLIQLIVLVPIALHACLIERHRFRDVLWLVLRTGMIYVALSAYWLVPALMAISVGSSIAAGTESLEAINMANSFPEVLRGLGMWTLYGADGNGWFDPGHISFVLAPLVVLLSFGGPIIAGLGVRLSRSPGRLFGTVSVLTGALVMVGSFPFHDQTPWGRALGMTIETVPGLIAFRTTNKAGAVLELGMAVLVGLGVMGIAPWVRSVWVRLVAGLGGVIIVAGSVFPALTGDLYHVPMDLPKYWNEAADVVNARGADSRVLMVPGTGLPAYSWGYFGPDEIGPSLFRRPFVYRSASPSGGSYASNLLAGVDMRLHQGTLPPGTVSTLAAYLGVGDVVGRYDVRGTGDIGARVESALNADPGLGAPQGFGPEGTGHGAPAPATVRPVAGPLPSTSATARSARGSLIVDGAGAALPNLQSAGLLSGRPGILLAGGLTNGELEEALGDEGRVVLTDSNGRREASNHNPAQSGALLSANEDPQSTRALFDTSDQTVAVVRGNARVTAAGQGLLFGPHATGQVTQAFDGDRTTGWQFGNFGSGVGNSALVRLNQPREVGTISLSPMQGGANRITSARVTASKGGGLVTKDVTFESWNTFPAKVDLGPGVVSAINIEVTGVDGSDDGPVGFSEIVVPGVNVRKVGVLPRGLVSRIDTAARAAGLDPADIPLDVVMRRSVGDANGLSAEEHRLEREFTLADKRQFTTSGTVRLAGGASDSRIDALSGRRGDIQAESSSRAFNNPNARASQAFDDTGGEPDRSTAWVPNEPVLGEWITLKFPERRLSSFSVTQGAVGARATKALVSVNDGEPFEVELGAGTHRVQLPDPVDASRVRILLAEREGVGFVRIEDIGLPRVPAPSGTPERCAVVGSVDGEPVRADIGAMFPRLLEGEAVPFVGCEPSLVLDQGRHDVGSVSDFAIDDLRFASTPRDAPVGTPPGVEVLKHGSASMDLRITGNCSPCFVSSGQSFDEGWEAYSGGKNLGKPVVIDAFAAGWRVNAAPGDVIHITFGPAKAALAAWLVTAAALLFCLGLLAAGVWRPRSKSGTSARPVAEDVVVKPV
ncbi:alpha-(1-_3)-arabinofuranosyltransferase family protein [Knoellia sp. S7-12]|uniref:alpha-(1->3)-arabinofuranosyltransferase domain-containing protein n=1 Tax=Knoellia sp. S7-12 TaxID=3126698 RepID=UPI0033698D93